MRCRPPDAPRPTTERPWSVRLGAALRAGVVARAPGAGLLLPAAFPVGLLELILAGRLDAGDLLVHRADQQVKRDAEGEDDEEAESPRGDVLGGREQRRGAHRHEVPTFSRTPANRSSSGSSVSTRDLAKW